MVNATGSSRQGVCLLGATGSIGGSTLDVLRQHSDSYQLIAVTANRDVEGLFLICQHFQPHYAVLADERCGELFRQRINAAGLTTEVLIGRQALLEVTVLDDVDVVVSAIVGAAGLLPTLEAVKHGKRVLLANKEALVMSGHLFIEAAQQSGAQLLPVDSEHNAIFQCMPADYIVGNRAAGVRRILLTASGGPFRTYALDELRDITPDQACAHPNWEMGRKISVDSATMMNKGLELIEACWLFGMGVDDIDIIIHPQSVIHSMVDYDDGSVLAQLGNPDMRTPIANALSWPERIHSGVEPLDLPKLAMLNFEKPDFERFRCLQLAHDAWNAGGTAPAILNAANELAVDAFLSERISFLAIADMVDAAMGACEVHAASDLDQILDDDRLARNYVEQYIGGKR
ncbi:MAG: 1-deoxy-D-xylulose-5-phosphate reductoisomerase [Gammaproteobacteria bacterium]|nr:1-deoxy-D-xylulose-5-phosphate reductoisomerase [Gammaproteobacteria bacterium]